MDTTFSAGAIQKKIVILMTALVLTVFFFFLASLSMKQCTGHTCVKIQGVKMLTFFDGLYCVGVISSVGAVASVRGQTSSFYWAHLSYGDRIQSQKRRAFKYKTGRSIMSRIVIVILIYHRHKPIDSINLLDS
jgi:nitrogen fixation protein FixH